MLFLLIDTRWDIFLGIFGYGHLHVGQNFNDYCTLVTPEATYNLLETCPKTIVSIVERRVSRYLEGKLALSLGQPTLEKRHLIAANCEACQVHPRQEMPHN